MLKQSLKFLLKDTAIYGLAGAITKFIAIFTIPILARVLTKEDYGILNTAIPFSAIFTGFIILGQDSSVARWFYNDGKNDYHYRKKIVSTGFFIQLTTTIFFIVVFIIFNNKIGELIFNKSDELIYFWRINLLLVPASAFFLFSISLFKWTFQRNKFLLLSLGNSILSISLTLILVITLKMGIMGAIIAPVISTNIFSLIGLLLNRNYISLKKIGSKQLFKDMLNYGWPFGIIMIVSAILPSVDRLFLLRYVNLETLGEYSISLKIASLLFLIISAFQISFGPYAFSIWHKEEAKELFNRLLIFYWNFLLFTGVTLSVFGDFIIKMFASQKYEASIIILPPLLIAYAINGLSEFSLLGISWSKKTYYNILTILIQFSVLFGFNYLLVHKFTVFGTTFSLIMANSVYIFVTFFISNKYYKIFIDFKKIFIVLIIAIVVHSIVVYNYFNQQTHIYIIKYLIFIFYSFFLFIFILKKKERLYIKDFMISAINKLKNK